MTKKYTRFSEFYPFYLSQHQNKVCRRLHFFGSIFIILFVFYILSFGLWTSIIYLPLIGYGFAWIGHYFFEKNKPATFTYPIYSFIGDWVMFKDIVMGRIKF